MGIKQKKANIESLAVVENEYMPVGSAIGLVAFADSSHSFYFRDTSYSVTFAVGNRKKKFNVDRSVYDKMREGDCGLLKYRGNKFIEFISEPLAIASSYNANLYNTN